MNISFSFVVAKNFPAGITAEILSVRQRNRPRKAHLPIWNMHRPFIHILKNVLKMPLRCILPTCGNAPNKEKCIALHKVSFYNDDRPEAKKRRKKWVSFINSKRTDRWQLSKDTAVCSAHFTRDSFVRTVFVPGTTPRLSGVLGLIQQGGQSVKMAPPH